MPGKKIDYCCICMANFENYFKHIKSEDHIRSESKDLYIYNRIDIILDEMQNTMSNYERNQDSQKEDYQSSIENDIHFSSNENLNEDKIGLVKNKSTVIKNKYRSRIKNKKEKLIKQKIKKRNKRANAEIKKRAYLSETKTDSIVKNQSRNLCENIKNKHCQYTKNRLFLQAKRKKI